MLSLPRLHTPAVLRLVHHAGDQRDDVFTGWIQYRNVVHGDLAYRIYRVAARTELCGQLNGIAIRQLMDLAEIVGRTPVMSGECCVSVPD